MKYRQEKVAENDWDGEFRTYEEWVRLGPQPPYRSATFLDGQGRPLHYSARFCSGTGRGRIPAEVLLGSNQGPKASLDSVGLPPIQDDAVDGTHRDLQLVGDRGCGHRLRSGAQARCCRCSQPHLTDRL
jgi:hypothetical protein